MLRRLRERLYVAACGRELAMERLGICGCQAACSIRAEMRRLAVDSLEYRIRERGLREVERLLSRNPDLFTSEGNHHEPASRTSRSSDAP